MSACPITPRLSRALFDGLSAELEAHVAACDACGRERAAIARLAGLARLLPEPAPSASRVEELRTALVAGTGRVPRVTRGRGGLLAALALGLAAAAALAVWQWPAGHASRALAVMDHGTVHAHTGARFIRLGGAPDEIVRLTQGTLTVEVKPLSPGQRFRVITGDAEVEVRGTAFDVVVDGDHLRSVRVLHGRVEVRPQSGRAVILTPGQRWSAPEEPKPVVAVQPAAAPEPPAAGHATAARLVPALAPRRRPEAHGPAMVLPGGPALATTRLPRPGEIAFDEGWKALRGGDNEAAAQSFLKAAGSAGSDPVAEDARFWGGVALARAGHHDKAIAQLELFADRYPASPRYGEASAMLGWLLVDSGDLGEAERRFRAAVDDRVPSIRESARKGLEAVAGRRVAERR